MRIASLTLTAGLLTAASPALAQLPPSSTVPNAVNQQFQLQNQLRGIQQQQNFDANTIRLQNQTNQMYNAPRNYGPAYIPRRGGVGGGRVSGGGRPERER